MAGQQADLARDASNFLTDRYLDVENQANAIAYGGQAAPYQFQQAQAMNRIPYLQQLGQQSMQNAYQSRSMENQYNYNRGLLEYKSQLENANKPSFLKQLGGQVLGNVVSTMVPGVSSHLGQQMYQNRGGSAPQYGGVQQSPWTGQI
jgi:hypothetical protein